MQSVIFVSFQRIILVVANEEDIGDQARVTTNKAQAL